MPEADGFDPLASLLTTRFRPPRDLKSVNLRALSPFHRALLVIDGTLTTFLEAYTLQPVDVIELRHETHALSSAHDWLEANRDTPITVRRVHLQGRYNQVIYAEATSLIVDDRVPAQVLGRLRHARSGIGRALLAGELETRREVLWFGRETVATDRGDSVAGRARTALSRTYRIIHRARPLMLINERFPLDAEAVPHHH